MAPSTARASTHGSLARAVKIEPFVKIVVLIMDAPRRRTQEAGYPAGAGVSGSS